MIHMLKKVSAEILSAYSNLPSYAKVIQYPSGNAAFSILLDKSFLDSKCDSVRFPDLTSHKGVNLVLLPIWMMFLRRRGVHIINIHWLTGPWQPPSIDSRNKRIVLWIYFVIWVNSMKMLGLRIVYTIHDHEPHSKIFNNDKRAIDFLVCKSDGVIFLNEESEKVFSDRLGGQLCTVISEGAIFHPTSKSKEETRNLLKVPIRNKLLVLVGTLQEYKGIDLIFSKISKLPSDVSIRIAGTAPLEYRKVIEDLKVISDRKKLDIDIRFDFLSEEEFGDYLEAADYFLYPCRLINNSGSLNAALSHGLPVIVPGMPELSWVPENCKICINGESPEFYDIESAIESLNHITADSYEEFSSNATSFSNERSWPKVVDKYIKFYEEISRIPNSKK